MNFKIYIQKLLIKLSRIIFFVTPIEFHGRETIYEKYCNETLSECYENFKKEFEKSIFLNNEEIRKYAIKNVLSLTPEPDKKYFIEFGVYKGNSINFFSKYVNKIYGFDSFEGLREDWAGNHKFQKSFFDLGGNIPKLESNVIPIKGWVQDTLDDFLTKEKPDILFLHMDLDTYESSKYVLERVKPYLSGKCYILFDNIYNHTGWKNGEYKALTEVFDNNEYKYLAFSINSTQALIEFKKNR